MLVFLSSLAVFLASVALAGAVKALPPAELKRQARSGKKGQIYKLVSYGSSLDILLGLLVISSFIGSILAAAAISWWLVAVVFALSLAAWLKDPNGKTGKVHWSLAGYIAYPADWMLRIMNPIFRRLAVVSRKPGRAHPHTKAYDKEDLLELLKHQAQQPDNRVDSADLQIARSALTFNDKALASVMTPKRKLKIVASGESVGPHLMDELHATGHSTFPVTKDQARAASPDIVGILYLQDIIDLSATGKVKDFMDSNVNFINEGQSLPEALHVFIKTRSQLLIVVNNFEEIVGTLSLEQLAKQIIGDMPADEFEHYDKLHAVAGLEKKAGKIDQRSVVK